MKNLRLLIFDMDGVVLNSEPLHEMARQAMFRKYHVVQGKDFPKAVGNSASGFWRQVIQQQGISADPMDLQAEQYSQVEEQIRQLCLGPIDGAVSAFNWAKKHGLKLAIASSSTQPLVDHALALIGVKDYFDIILSGDDVHHKKPDPEIYRRVLEIAGIPPEEAIAVEDSTSGVIAAQGAGLYCFGFHNPDSGNQDLTRADRVIESLEELPGVFSAMIGEA